MSSSNTDQLLDPETALDASVNVPGAGSDIDRGSLASKAGRWASKGGLAILDQGLISGSNFLIGILLARWLMPVEYGAFSLAFSVFLLVSYVYQSLLSEPQAVFSGSAYRHCLRGYLKALLRIQVVVTVFGIVLLGGSAAVVYAIGKADGLPGALAGVAIASPCILFFWLLRRSYYMNLAPARAAMGAFIYFVLVTGGLVVAYRRSLISPFSAYLLMAIGALGTGLFLLSQVKKVLPADTVTAPTPAEAWHKHWEYGRWALAVSVVTWIPYYMYYPLVSMFSGMAAAGQLKALMNLALPLEQSYTALAILFLPYAARVCREKGAQSSGPLVRRITLLFVAGAVVYWGLLIPFKGIAFHVLYGGKYMEVAPLIPYVAVGTTMWSAAFGPAILLRAIESPDSIFYARVVASILSLVIGVPATKVFGLWGVVASVIIANIAAFLISMYILQRKSTSMSLPNPILQGES
jgi:O-antigen/teichoic acid export membrane protein